MTNLTFVGETAGRLKHHHRATNIASLWTPIPPNKQFDFNPAKLSAVLEFCGPLGIPRIIVGFTVVHLDGRAI
jgi:hypothetical protein